MSNKVCRCERGTAYFKYTHSEGCYDFYKCSCCGFVKKVQQVGCF